jgi:hypothetical protein
MLLCHVCSFWRTVALTAATLWTDLFCSFTIAAAYDATTASWTYEFVESEIEFVQWWKKNQGSIAPSIVLDVYKRTRDEITEKLAGDRMEFLIEYLASAQFLSLDAFYWDPIHDRIKAGYPVTFPNLQHLAMNFGWREDKHHAFYHVQTLLPAHSLSPLRRLSISDDMDALPDDFVVPNHWSTLTHISLSKVRISLRFWFSFIRTVPNLQWGYFDLTILNSNYPTPSPCTLSQLTTLHVAINRIKPALSFAYQLRRLFNKLQMPGLRTLSLSALPGPSWAYHRGYANLYGVLSATPSLTTLALGGNFLALHTGDTAAVLSEIHDVAPVWHRAPQLAHLQLDRPATDAMGKKEAKDTVDRFVRNVCGAGSGWLDLQNPACPIRSIAICDTAKARRPDPPRRDFTLSTMQRDGGRVSEVVFEISAEFAERFGEGMRREWDSRPETLQRSALSDDSFCK